MPAGHVDLRPTNGQKKDLKVYVGGQTDDPPDLKCGDSMTYIFVENPVSTRYDASALRICVSGVRPYTKGAFMVAETVKCFMVTSVEIGAGRGY